MKLLLVNPNQVKPPLPPIGLDYLHDLLIESGHNVELLDALVHAEFSQTLKDAVVRVNPELVGLTVRNIDDCQMFTQKSFVPDIQRAVRGIKSVSSALIVLGGPGFAVMPRELMRATGADFGVVGDGEVVFPQLLENLASPESVPNVFYWDSDSDGISFTQQKFYSIKFLPAPKRDIVDYGAYIADGGICNVQTKRGCNQRCIYCTEPRIVGDIIRGRDPQSVIEELRHLERQIPLEKMFVVDSEFNTDYIHAAAMAEAIIRSGIRMSWTCYMTANNVDKEFINLIKAAGCEMIIWSIDSGCDKMLENLGKGITIRDILQVSRWCDEVGQNYTHVLLVGGPGETKQTIEETHLTISKTLASAVGIVSGIRIYPGTELFDVAMDEGVISERQDFLEPIYYKKDYVIGELYPHVLRVFGGMRHASILGPDKSTPFTDEKFQKKLRDSSRLLD